MPLLSKFESFKEIEAYVLSRKSDAPPFPERTFKRAQNKGHFYNTLHNAIRLLRSDGAFSPKEHSNLVHLVDSLYRFSQEFCPIPENRQPFNPYDHAEQTAEELAAVQEEYERQIQKLFLAEAIMNDPKLMSQLLKDDSLADMVDSSFGRTTLASLAVNSDYQQAVKAIKRLDKIARSIEPGMAEESERAVREVKRGNHFGL